MLLKFSKIGYQNRLFLSKLGRFGYLNLNDRNKNDQN